MRKDQSDSVTKIVHEAVQASRDAEAHQVARGLIQGYIGPDHKVMSMQSFHWALVQALKEARLRGQDDCGVLTLS